MAPTVTVNFIQRSILFILKKSHTHSSFQLFLAESFFVVAYRFRNECLGCTCASERERVDVGRVICTSGVSSKKATCL